MIAGALKRIRAALARIPMEEINGGRRCPTYLYRWELVSFFGGRTRIYLHKFVGDDWALDLHDHPKRFWSIGLRGRYTEKNEQGTREFRAPWLRTFPASHRHRLIGPTESAPCWTLVIVGAPIRSWGFWQDGNFIDWRHYVAPGSGARIACEP